MLRNKVILVTPQNEIIGEAEKLEAHQKGLLHRAFSILVQNSKGEILLQKRASDKYHCGGLWTNTCCSHPQPNENLYEAAHERLMAEMGFDCELTYKGDFLYKAEFDNGLIEHELDAVFFGKVDDIILKPDPSEVEDYKWISINDLHQNLILHPQEYTVWFPHVLSFLDK